jgi:hypothetical protein
MINQTEFALYWREANEKLLTAIANPTRDTFTAAAVEASQTIRMAEGDIETEMAQALHRMVRDVAAENCCSLHSIPDDDDPADGIPLLPVNSTFHRCCNAIGDHSNTCTVMPDSFFRSLDTGEAETFRAWARANWKPGVEINTMWHPVVRDEIAVMKQEQEVCVCGHGIEDHNYSPSGCGMTTCMWAESWDENGFPVGLGCPSMCREYITKEDES